MAVLSLIFAVTLPSSAFAAAVVVTDIRVGAHGGATRVVLDLTDQVTFSAFTLANPYRVVLDLPEVGWRLPARPLPAAAGVFQRLRYGLFQPGNSRVVLDVSQPVVIDNAFVLGPNGASGHRLVIDLRSTSREAFLKTAGQPPVRSAAGGPSEPTRAALAPPRRPAPSQPANADGPQAVSTPFRLAPRKPEPKRSDRKRVVMLDPGHGGVDPGTIGISGVYEKHITLSMARELKAALEDSGRYKVLMTRDRDIFIRLRDRVQIARDAKAELFISIHADTVKDRSIKGPAVYTLSERASDREAAQLAEKENKADLIAGMDLTHETPEVTNILIDLAQRESMNQSARFAGTLIRELKRQTRVLRNTHRFAGFAVLKAPDVPSVLLELGFLSNPTDERNLRSRRYRARLARATLSAVDAYFARIEEATRR